MASCDVPSLFSAIALSLCLPVGTAIAAIPNIPSVEGLEMTPVLTVPNSAEAELANWLRLRQQSPDRAAEIDALIRDRFGTVRTVMVIDMSGFSQLTETFGIIATLQEIYRLRDLSIPMLEASGGSVFKAEADSLYATFDSPAAAIAAADDLLTLLNAAGLHASIGIGHGEVLLIGDREVYGAELNLASRLGEDLAAADEILITEAAYTMLLQSNPEIPASFERRETTASGLTFPVYTLQRAREKQDAQSSSQSIFVSSR